MHTLEQLQTHLTYDPDTGQFTWNAGGRKRKRGSIAGYPSDGYIYLAIENKVYRAHRVAWLFVHGQWPTKEIDHINGNRADNRIANLRDVSHRENVQGARRLSPRNKTGYTGVSWNTAKQCFTATIMRDGKAKFLGCFDTAEEAADAYANHKNVPETGKRYRARRPSVAPQYP